MDRKTKNVLMKLYQALPDELKNRPYMELNGPALKLVDEDFDPVDTSPVSDSSEDILKCLKGIEYSLHKLLTSKKVRVIKRDKNNLISHIVEYNTDEPIVDTNV